MRNPLRLFLVSTIHMVVRAKSCVFAFFVFDFCIFLYFREIGRHSCRQWKLQKIIDQSYRWICFFDESHSYGINFTCTSKIRLFIEYYRYFRRISRVLEEYLSRFCNYGLMNIKVQLWRVTVMILCLVLSVSISLTALDYTNLYQTLLIEVTNIPVVVGAESHWIW